MNQTLTQRNLSFLPKITMYKKEYSVATQRQKIEVIETMTKFQWLQPCNTVFTAVHISYIASMESMCSSLSYNYGLLQLLLRKGSNSESPLPYDP